MSWHEADQVLAVPNTVVGCAMLLAGWPIVHHQRRNAVGWVLLGGALGDLASGLGAFALMWASARSWHGVGWRLVASATDFGWGWSFALCLPLVLVLFPDGKLPSRRWLPLVALMTVVATALTLQLTSSRDSTFSDQLGYRSYLHVPGVTDDFLRGLNGPIEAGMLTVYVGAVVCLALQYRRAGATGRRAIAWVLLALVVLVAGLVVIPQLVDSNVVLVILSVVPVAIWLSTLRRRLLDIELVFSRSLAYGILTIVVVGAYLLLAAGLHHVLGQSTAADVVSALAVALVFNPTRTWLQGLVDRAVYGARRDPVRAVAQVGARMGESGELTDVLDALRQAMRLPYAAMTVSGATVAASGQGGAATHVITLSREDESELVIGLRTGESSLTEPDRRVLSLLAAPLAVALRSKRLAEELSRSRGQVIVAREEERRRLRRDLHDGLGPVLTGVVLNADAARRLVPTDPARSEELLVGLRNQVTEAIEDIRRLVYDLRPPVLESLGLLEALREQASVLAARADGQPLHVEVGGTCAAELPAAVEIAAYRIITEALTNVSRHSSATAAIVTLTMSEAGLDLRVHDDGTNIDSGWQPGVGLNSIRERASELGGWCTISLDRTGGRVEAYLPITRVATRQPTR